MAKIIDLDVLESLDSVYVRLRGKEHRIRNAGLMDTYLKLMEVLESIGTFDVKRDRAKYPDQVRATFKSTLDFLQTLLPGAPVDDLRQMAYVQVLYLLKNLVIKMEEDAQSKTVAITPHPTPSTPQPDIANRENEFNLRILECSKGE